MEYAKNWFGWQIAAKNNFYTGNESAHIILQIRAHQKRKNITV